MKLKELIDYTPKGVTDKTVINNESGMAMILAVDKGAAIATHSAHADVIVQIIEGVCDFTVAGETHRLTTGEYIVMKPDTPHSLNAPESFKALVTKFNVQH